MLRYSQKCHQFVTNAQELFDSFSRVCFARFLLICWASVSSRILEFPLPSCGANFVKFGRQSPPGHRLQWTMRIERYRISAFSILIFLLVKPFPFLLLVVRRFSSGEFTAGDAQFRPSRFVAPMRKRGYYPRLFLTTPLQASDLVRSFSFLLSSHHFFPFRLFVCS